MSSYLSELNHRGARPRSKRLRQMGASASGGASTVIINGGDLGHTHANKRYLDQLSTDADDYLYINQLRQQTDAETGETTDVTAPQKVKAGHADIAHDLDPDSPANERYLRKDQDDRTEHSLGVGGDLIIDGAAHIGQAMLVYDEVNHAIRVTAADGSGLTIGLWADGFISAMGLNSTGGSGGSGGGASALYQLVDVVVNATGDGVNGAAVGKVLMYNGTKWEAATVVIPTKLSQFIDDIGLLSEAEGQAIIDALSSHTGNKSNPHAVSFSQLTSHPTTVEGYGITNALTDDDGNTLAEAIGDASQQAREAMSVALRAEFIAEHALDDLFELVNLGTDEEPSYAIRAKFGFYSDSFVSAMGLNSSGASGGSGSGGASALYQLVDVVANATGDGVSGAAVGKVLMYNGTKWEAATVVIPTKLSQFIDDIGLLYDSDGQALAESIADAVQRAATAQGAADMAQSTADRAQDAADQAQDAADKAATDSASALSAHTSNKSNPHAVTKAQIGLGSVDNLAAAAYFTALSSTSANNLSATIGGSVRSITALYATYLGGQPSSYYAAATALISHTSNKNNPHAVSFSQLTSHPTTVEGYGITNALTDDDGNTLAEAIGDALQRAREAMSVASKLQREVDRQLDNDDAHAVISYLMQEIRQLSDQVSRLNAEVNQLSSYWQLDANGDLYTKHNLYSQKAITAMKTV